MLRGERIKLFKSSEQARLQNEYRVVIESIVKVLPYMGNYDAKPHTPEFYQQQKFYFPNGEKGDWTPLPLKEGDRPWRPSTEGMIEGDIMECVQAAYAVHLGIHLPFDDLKPYFHRGVEVAYLYFCGDWRANDKPSQHSVWTHRECRQNMNWIDSFSRGLLLSLLVDDNIHITNIAGWVGDDLEEDGTGTYTLNDVWYLIALGRFLRKESFSEYTAKIKSKSRRRQKFLIDVLESIDKRDVNAFETGLTTFIKYFIKNEVDTTEWFESNISRDASVLWNAARHVGMVMPDFPEKVMDRIVTPQTIGLEQ
ncbi:MAG: hypothetical protein LBU65_09285 [Planctomycetaceae bacterium]|jgi:hypothetical protein|nr:hypothetical protein [Planctomycetaceae bacterium]